MPSPTRRGIVKNLTLDSDALELLTIMAPSNKRIGAFVSELLRREWACREVRREERERLARMLVDREGECVGAAAP